MRDEDWSYTPRPTQIESNAARIWWSPVNSSWVTRLDLRVICLICLRYPVGTSEDVLMLLSCRRLSAIQKSGSIGSRVMPDCDHLVGTQRIQRSSHHCAFIETKSACGARSPSKIPKITISAPHHAFARCKIAASASQF